MVRASTAVNLDERAGGPSIRACAEAIGASMSLTDSLPLFFKAFDMLRQAWALAIKAPKCVINPRAVLSPYT